MSTIIGASGLERNCGKRIAVHRRTREEIITYFDAELCRDSDGRFFVTGGTKRTIREGSKLGDHKVQDLSLDATHRVYFNGYEEVTIPISHGIRRTYRAVF